MDQPEASGPSSETEDFSTAEFDAPGWRIGGPPVPARDPAAEAILRNIEAEHQADALKQVPADATDMTSQPVTPPPPKRRPHRRTSPAEPVVLNPEHEPEPADPEET
jgi:hypothetical protein